jgi:hypothetical protein
MTTPPKGRTVDKRFEFVDVMMTLAPAANAPSFDQAQRRRDARCPAAIDVRYRGVLRRVAPEVMMRCLGSRVPIRRSAWGRRT